MSGVVKCRQCFDHFCLTVKGERGPSNQLAKFNFYRADKADLQSYQLSYAYEYPSEHAAALREWGFEWLFSHCRRVSR